MIGYENDFFLSYPFDASNMRFKQDMISISYHFGPSWKITPLSFEQI